MKKQLQTIFSTRQYMLSKDFEIYYYDDAHFSGVSNHTHDYYEFYFFLNGNVSMFVDGIPFKLQTGDVIMIPPDVPHHAVSTGKDAPYQRFVFWISQDYCKELMALSPDYVYIMQKATHQGQYIFHYDTIAFNALQAKVFRLIEELLSDRFGKDAKVSLCVNDLILHLNRTVYELEHPGTQKEEQNLYEQLLHYIETHLDEDLSLDTLAKNFYISKFHIAHIFKENLGLSIHQYITKKGSTCAEMPSSAAPASVKPMHSMDLRIIPVSFAPLRKNMAFPQKNIRSSILINWKKKNKIQLFHKLCSICAVFSMHMLHNCIFPYKITLCLA